MTHPIFFFGNATSDALRKLDEDTLLAVFEGVPQFEISRDALAEGVKAVDLFVDNAAVFASKGEMRKLVQGGGVSLNKEKLTAFDQVITTADLLDEKYLLVQRGKRTIFADCKVIMHDSFSIECKKVNEIFGGLLANLYLCTAF